MAKPRPPGGPFPPGFVFPSHPPTGYPPKAEPEKVVPKHEGKITVEQLAQIIAEFEKEHRNWSLNIYKQMNDQVHLEYHGREIFTRFPMKDEATAKSILAAQCLGMALRTIGLEVETIFDKEKLK